VVDWRLIPGIELQDTSSYSKPNSMSFIEALPTYGIGGVVALGGVMGFKKARSFPR